MFSEAIHFLPGMLNDQETVLLLIAKEVNRVGDTIKSRMLSMLKLQDLGPSSSSTKVSGFLE